MFNTPQNMKAVLLAAGRGVRIQGLAQEKPKSLLEIGSLSLSNPQKTTFLERQISCLRACNVQDIAVVVGYHKEEIYKQLARNSVQIIENTHPNLSESGSLHSFQFAMNSDFQPLDQKSHLLLMDADIVYEKRVLNDFLTQLKETSILIHSHINTDSEEVRVYGEKNQPFFIGKGLKPILVNQLPCLGEATGIVHFAPQDHELVENLTNWLLGNPNAPKESMERKGFGPAKIDTEHEELTQRLMNLHKIHPFILPKDRIFMEVDFEEEYTQLIQEEYSKILEADAHYFNQTK